MPISLVVDGRPFYTCSEVAKAIHRSPLTIRRWEKKGLIPRPKRQKSSNWRLYSDEDLASIAAFAGTTVPGSKDQTSHRLWRRNSPSSLRDSCRVKPSAHSQESLLSKKPIPIKQRLILALDIGSVRKSKNIVMELDDAVEFYKIGLAWVVSNNYLKFIRYLKDKGKKVFVDLKMFDIPKTVASAVAKIRKHSVDFLTIHGNDAVMRAATSLKKAAPGKKHSYKHLGDNKILAVTALTSLDQMDLQDLGLSADVSVKDLVLSRARRALEIGCDGIVSSGLEVSEIRKQFGDKLIVVVPGIRPMQNTDDQKRTVNVEKAFRYGADYIVVGRPITKARSPSEAAQSIQGRIADIFSHQ